MAPKVKLVYFSLQGMGEIIRLTLHAGKVTQHKICNVVVKVVFRVIYCSLRGQFSFTNQLTNQGPFKLRERLLLVAVAVFTGLYFFILLLFL